MDSIPDRLLISTSIEELRQQKVRLWVKSVILSILLGIFAICTAVLAVLYGRMLCTSSAGIYWTNNPTATKTYAVAPVPTNALVTHFPTATVTEIPTVTVTEGGTTVTVTKTATKTHRETTTASSEETTTASSEATTTETSEATKTVKSVITTTLILKPTQTAPSQTG